LTSSNLEIKEIQEESFISLSFLEFGLVKITEKDYQRLIGLYQANGISSLEPLHDLIESLDNRLAEGKESSINHFATLRNWFSKRRKEGSLTPKKKSDYSKSKNSYDGFNDRVGIF
jgi:hypothetical protein